ncbi:MAG: phosphonopyruvate decarboxylase [Gemmatimonadota bacterium]
MQTRQPDELRSPVEAAWPDQIFACFKAGGIKQVGYVPDAGHARLIQRCRDDSEIDDVLLTTEEEGVALAAGAWLGGDRAALLMQSSGVGNCINMLSLIKTCRFPFLTLVTMRGEWEEFNPWQVPMGTMTPDVLRLCDVHVSRVETEDEVEGVVAAAIDTAFTKSVGVAVLLSQCLIGKKRW